MKDSIKVILEKTVRINRALAEQPTTHHTSEAKTERLCLQMCRYNNNNNDYFLQRPLLTNSKRFRKEHDGEKEEGGGEQGRMIESEYKSYTRSNKAQLLHNVLETR